MPEVPFLKTGIFVVRATVGETLGEQTFITPYGLDYLSKRWRRQNLKAVTSADLFGNVA